MPGELDDSRDGTRLWTAYATWERISAVCSRGLDIYYIGSEDPARSYTQGAGDEQRHTVGARVFGSQDATSWNLEGFYQGGSFDSPATGRGSINAWSVASDLRYHPDDSPFAAELKVNVISGDRDPNSSGLQTFNPLFPKARYFGELTLLGPQNLFNVHPSVEWHFASGLHLAVASVFNWRQSTADGIYDVSGNVLRSAGGSDRRYIGTKLETVVEWAVDRRTDLIASASWFFAGDFLEDTGDSETVNFFAFEARYRF
jgi:hypothetical protein